MKNFIESFIVIYKNEENRSFIRKSKRPFTKWYVKQYHEIYKLKKKNLDIVIKSLSTEMDEGKILIKNLKKSKKELVKIYKIKMKELKETLDIKIIN